MRILLYAEGDFTYTHAICKMLANELKWDKKSHYEIVATDFEKHNDINELKEKIESMFPEMGVKDRITLSFLDQIDATEKNIKISGQFNKIICNFPTPFGNQKLSIDKMLKQVKNSNLLVKGGVVELRYWVDDYENKYEYAYRISKACKINGFKLKSRQIVDIKELEKLGYNHILYSGEKGVIDHLPMVSTFQLREDAKNELLQDNEYTELSDSEEMPNDAMPLRWPNRWYGSSHLTEELNIYGNKETRWSHLFKVYNSNPKKYSIEDISNLIEMHNYREADRRLTLLLEAGEKRILNVSCDDRFYHWISKPIDQAYEKSNISKPTQENLEKYHQYDWYAKLKVLTGVKIPDLVRSYKWN